MLVDSQAPDEVLESVRTAIEGDSVRLIDLHVWEIGPGYRSAILVVESDHPLSPGELKQRLPDELCIAHATVEIHERKSHSGATRSERTQ